MSEHVLVTGGAGFIGSHLVDSLVSDGHTVRVLDNMDEQVHGGKKPDYLNPGAEYIIGDVCEPDDVRASLGGVSVVFHFASAVGVGQSMYRIAHYVRSNSLGTAVLMDEIVNHETDVRKVIVASSMATYGEGAYSCEKCGTVRPPLRGEEQMRLRKWGPVCPSCGGACRPIPTSEDAHQRPNSVYALGKRDQEHMVLMLGRTYGFGATALRFFNVYGPRQSLSNPYTGVCAIFSSRIKNGNPVVIFEDGFQTRDFISVHDVVRANLLSMERPEANGKVFNVGSGTPVTIKEIATTLADLYGSDVRPRITEEFRKGDVRHCYADMSRIRSIGFEPSIGLADGLRDLVDWGSDVEANDGFDQAERELEEKGLI